MAIHRRPSEEQQEAFLEKISEGMVKQEAAEAVGCTSTMFRTFINGRSEESMAFAARYVEVLANAGRAPSPLAKEVRELEQIQLAHRVFDEFIMRALDAERGRSGSSNRMLHNLSILNVESFKPLLEARTRHIHEGSVGIYQLPKIDVDKWSIEEHEEWVRLEARRNELISIARPDDAPPLPALEAGNGKGEVVEDAEFVEVP